MSDMKPFQGHWCRLSQDIESDCTPFGGNELPEFLTYQLQTVAYLSTVATTGNGGLGFGSGEGA